MPGPFVPGVNVAQVNMLYTQNAEFVENVYYVKGAAAWTATSLGDLCTAFAGWETTSAHGMRHASTSLQKITARDLTTQNSLTVESTDGMPIVGTQLGQAFPNNVTLAIAHRTGFSGRSFRGRTYWIGLHDTNVTGNTIQPATLSALLSVYAPLVTGSLFPNGGQLVVFSRVSGGVPRTTGLATPVTGFTIDVNVDSQRRRLPGHNRHR